MILSGWLLLCRKEAWCCLVAPSLTTEGCTVLWHHCQLPSVLPQPTGPLLPAVLPAIQMPALRRAFLRSTGVSGGLSCNLVENPVLVLLGLSENDGITGTIPSCFLRVRGV